ncbi:DUF5979 domain-containing protein [Actinomyces capricornis]|nr:DUF5979 domain-containing protein [Actinomyces capricornis]
MRLSFDWDASNANASAGDSFRIGLPELFRNREQLTQDLKVSHGGREVSIGQCVLSEQDITCTFNAEFDTLKGQGFNNPKGSGSALLQAIRATDQANADIDANGIVTAVPIPGGSIADNTGLNYEPERLRKYSEGVKLGDSSISWEVSFGFPGLNDALQAEGKSVIADGNTRSTVVLTDELTPSHSYSTDKKDWTLVIGTSTTRNALIGTVTNAAGEDTNTDHGDFDLTVDITGDRATITATGPFAADTNYHVYYRTNPTSENQTVQPGVVYSNNIRVQDTGIQTSYSTYYVRSFNINVELKPGFGGFTATKLLSGAGAGLVSDGTTFDLTVDYVLPGGATTDTYQGWNAPGTVNPDKTGGRTTLKLTAGSSATYNGTFPTGTVLTLSEDPTTASTTPQGFAWGEPTFMVGDQATNTLTIQEQASTAVSVTNTADFTQAINGVFTLSKQVTGDGQFSDSTFTFSYTCDNGAKGDLEVPGDGTIVPSPELPAGTSCTITEDVDAAAKPGFTLVPSLSTNSVTIKAGGSVPVNATNTYSNNTGTFQVTKAVTGADAFSQDAFEIGYTCTPPAGAGSPQTATLQVTAGGPAQQGPTLPEGTVCVISETDATKAREGHSVATTITVDGTATSTVTIARGKTAEVAVTNTYTPLAGSFQVTKTVDGAAAAKAPSSFSFDYTCVKDGKETAKDTLALAAGESKSVAGVPAGSTCTVTEKDASVEGLALTTALSVDDTKVEGSKATFDIADGVTVTVAATNTYEPTTGTFIVAKGIVDGRIEPARAPETDGAAAGGDDASTKTDPATEGGEAAEADGTKPPVSNEEVLAARLWEKEFTFTYTCDDPATTTGTIKVKGEGEAEAGVQLPVGTTCTITEDEASAQAMGYTLTPPGPEKVTISGAAKPERAVIWNAYERATGTFSVAKAITEEPALPEGAEPLPSDSSAAALREKEFTFTYTCDDPATTTGTIKVKGEGEAEAGVQLPVGTTCTITEDETSAQAEGYTLTPPGPEKVTIKAGVPAVKASFVNRYHQEKPAPSPTPSVTPSTTPEPGPAPSQDPTPGMPGPEPSPSHTCLTPAPSPSGTPGQPGADPSASGTPEAGMTSPASDPSSSPSADPCAPPVSPDPGGSSLARTGASLGAVLVALIGLVGGAAVLSHRRRI